MTTRGKVLVGVGVVLVAAAVVAANLYYKKADGKIVAVEGIKKRDLESVVSASGKIQAKTQVNVSADTMGRVTELAVMEGDIVKRGQFLMQIDPRNLQSNFARGEAGVAAAEATLNQLRNSIDLAKENLKLAQDNLTRQKNLWSDQLTTREALQRAGLAPADVGYLNLHGTATPQNDAMESRAVAELFGLSLPCSSTKPLTGHALGAAGAIEAAIAWLTVTGDGHLPVHHFDGQRDAELPPIALVAPGQRLSQAPRHVMSNSFAFGGNNASLVLSHV